MKKLVVKPDAEPIFLKLADKGVSAEEREKSVVTLRKRNTRRGNLIQLCVSILFCFTCCEKNWIF